MGASTEHQLIIGNIYYFLRQKIQQFNNKKPLSEQTIMLLAPYTLMFKTVFISKYNKNSSTSNFLKTEPDLSLFINHSSVDFNKVHTKGSPDLVIEVLSPTTRENDLDGNTGKKIIYEYNKIKEYWVIDPENKSLTAYILGQDEKYKEGEINPERITSTNFPFVEICVTGSVTCHKIKLCKANRPSKCS